MRKQEKKKPRGVGEGWSGGDWGAEGKVGEAAEGLANQEKGCRWVVGGGLQKTGQEKEKKG